MRVLIDECLPRQLKGWLAELHDAHTVQEFGWANVKNGRLLRLADEAGFDVLVTADKNIHFQQNFSGPRISALCRRNGRTLNTCLWEAT
jgi:predicted nuclease of predicted toxin-antitoxin system